MLFLSFNAFVNHKYKQHLGRCNNIYLIMVKLKLTSWSLNPINVICLIMLGIIMFMLSGDKPAEPQPVEEPIVKPAVIRIIEKPYEEDLMRDYQLKSVKGGDRKQYMIMYDHHKVIGVLPLDNHCNLTNLILEDNQ